ncbi:Putative NADPH-quinone reductase (modulator of drug activity B) [Lishizhenia tianjinensis]|uniref:Putative NADPH-quinone reductase (Modulator of drug activity B) n=1 Tax=Lishizhenia tianjinensis TaxID=477690 RepID=A0A1I6YV15_9FLAO|nr:NAD(P)H-dependent oxidoreductase [Lishizhenia tianjinensis]SFT54267.1 Putative NADPH-quinone reductase (modulator of drug activity B) [Lishizhenia tianjinensis]
MKILVINGHPDPESYNYALSEAYYKGAQEEGLEIQILHLKDLEFNPNLKFGYRKRSTLEPDLEKAINLMNEADHLVWIFPVWWASLPALLKGFIDRSFLPGITYAPQKGLPKKLWKGKTARLIFTSDSPKWYFRLYLHRPVLQQMKKGVLQFCGVGKVKYTHISIVKNSTDTFRNKYLEKVLLLGKGGK